MAVSIAEVKEYCHAEGESDATMALYLGMAEDYLTGAGITETLATADGYALVAKALTLHYYDNRGGAPIPDGLRDYIRQQQCRCRKAALEAAAESQQTSDDDSAADDGGEDPE